MLRPEPATFRGANGNRIMTTLQPMQYSVEQVCEVTQQSRNIVYDAINAGHLKSYLIGRRRWFKPAAVQAWVDYLEREASKGRPVAYRARPPERRAQR